MACVVLLLGVQPLNAEVLLTLGSGAYWYQAAATTGAVNQFLGHTDTPDGGTGGDFGGRDSVDTNRPLRLKYHSAVALTWRHGIQLNHRLEMVGDVRLEYGRTRWFVKGGINILRDDLTAKLHHVSLTPTLGLRMDLPPVRHWHSDITGGIGTTRLVARTHITSALLNLRRTDHFTNHFAFVRLGLGPTYNKKSGRALLEAQWRRSTGLNLRLGLEHKF